MSDYHFTAGILRDQIVSELADNLEQTPYVVAELASRLERGTMDFDDFMDGVRTLDDNQQKALLTFCNAVSLSLSEETV
ncbi:hypothetical protein DEM26_08870 [Thioclava sp. NG1]|uniref:hypothetical protein n=1 Tax=Thioclava sp. NG1 TaxID=2182426 RepID=UPI000D60B04A|nr:hypothetical protein [Thioclava sp. NG1]PWE50052.1 hypothetical protein DEM26_08870 [Thioclava sp. NG1]